MVSRFDAPAIRRYLDELGYPVDPHRLVDHHRQLPSTLCYLVSSGRLLMLKRRKEPFEGHWTAPGGKIKPGETPLDAVVRELREETGLTILDPRLKVICSESGDEHYNWLLFIFRAHRYEGEPRESDEGVLEWIPLEELPDRLLPDVDRHVLSYILDDSEEPRFIRVVYDQNHYVAEFDARSLAEFCV